MRFQDPCDDPRTVAGAAAESIVVPPSSNVAKTRPGGWPESETITSHVPTSAFADACPLEAEPDGAIAAPAARTNMSATTTRVATSDFCVSFPTPFEERDGDERLVARSNLLDPEREEVRSG